MIAALNRDDRHHRWAINVIATQRKLRAPIVVPEVVIGEAYTKLRYDRRVIGRGDARPALTVFGLLAADSELFEIRGMPDESHRRSVGLLARYVDQAFSLVDAIVLLSADDDRRVEGSGRWTRHLARTASLIRFWYQVQATRTTSSALIRVRSTTTNSLRRSGDGFAGFRSNSWSKPSCPASRLVASI